MSATADPGASDPGGDPACWLDRVCDRCGAMIEGDAARHVCGHTLNVDGGVLTAGRMLDQAPQGAEAQRGT